MSKEIINKISLLIETNDHYENDDDYGIMDYILNCNIIPQSLCDWGVRILNYDGTMLLLNCYTKLSIKQFIDDISKIFKEYLNENYIKRVDVVGIISDYTSYMTSIRKDDKDSMDEYPFY
jgi:hypothetical protein